MARGTIFLNWTTFLGDLRYVGTDQVGGLLVDVTFSSITVVLLEVGEGRRGRNRIHVVVTVVVEGDVDKGIVGQSKYQVADVIGLGRGKFFKDRFDSPLVFVGVIFRFGRVTRYQSLLHGDPL